MKLENEAGDDFLSSIVQRAVTEVVNEARGEDVTDSQLAARAQMRYSELTAPFRGGVEGLLHG